MAVYKVPQDVEAEDKLLGPFSFRQFVYLIIAAISGLVGWLLWGLSPFLSVIPVPVVAFFLILALPLRKDQPMEIYLIAVVQFFLKPKKRLWSPDGTMSLVQITAPKVIERHLSKSISENEAVNRLSYLAEIMDTRGWAARGVKDMGGTSVNSAIAKEADEAEDVLDKGTSVAKSFDTLIEQKNTAQRSQAIATMQRQARQSEPSAQPQGSSSIPRIPGNPYTQFVSNAPSNDTDEESDAIAAAHAMTTPVSDSPHPAATAPAISQDSSGIVHYNPYPTSMHQQVIQPVEPSLRHALPETDKKPDSVAEKPGAETVSPDIINLANNPDLSISTIAHEAKRLQDKRGDETEVVIPLR